MVTSLEPTDHSTRPAYSPDVAGVSVTVAFGEIDTPRSATWSSTSSPVTRAPLAIVRPAQNTWRPGRKVTESEIVTAVGYTVTVSGPALEPIVGFVPARHTAGVGRSAIGSFTPDSSEVVPVTASRVGSPVIGEAPHAELRIASPNT